MYNNYCRPQIQDIDSGHDDTVHMVTHTILQITL